MTTPKGPHIDWAGLSPLLALLGAAILVLLIGLLRPRAVREVLVPLLALAGFLAAIGLGIWQMGEQKDLIAGALRLDDLTIVLSFVFCAGGVEGALCAPSGATGSFAFSLARWWPTAQPPSAPRTA